MSKFSQKTVPRFDRGEALSEALSTLRQIEEASGRTRVRPSRDAHRKQRRIHVRLSQPDPRLDMAALLNEEGGLAFGRDDRTMLATMAACCLVNERAFYGDTTGKVRLLLHRVANSHPEWTVKLAVFLRERLNLRSISQLVLAHAAMIPASRPFVFRAFPRVIVRPDDMIELTALLKDGRHGLAHGLPAVIRRGLGASLNRLSDFHAVKYRKAGQLGLRHVVQLCHPQPTSPAQSALFRYLLDRQTWDELPQDMRKNLPAVEAWEALRKGKADDLDLLDLCVAARLPWEVIVPKFGSQPVVWRRIAPTLPIMALLRNLRNLHQMGCLRDSRLRKHIAEQLTNPGVIHNSRQLPFRWLSTYRVMQPIDPAVGQWIEQAMELSVANLPRLPGRTAIACDNSGSMSGMNISGNSTICPKDIASLMGAVANRMCDTSCVYVFGSELERVQLKESMRILRRAEKIGKTDVGHATFAHKVIERLLLCRRVVDRLLVFTDMEIYGESAGWSGDRDFTSLLREYRMTVNPTLRTYIFNLAAYGQSITPADEIGVTYFSGWNPNLLQYVAVDSDPGVKSMVSLVDRVQL